MNNNILYLLFFEHFFYINKQYNIYDVFLSDDILTLVSYILNNLVIDRANILNQYSRFNIAVPTHIDNIEFDRNIEYKNYDLSYICNEISSYYIKKSEQENKKLAVLWSGGVDSTVELCAFLQNKKLNLNNFIVLLTNDSISENKYFFDNYIDNKCKYIKYNPDEYSQFINNIYSNYIFVSGHNGDQLFGHKFCYKYPQFYGMYYFDVLPDIYQIFLPDRDKKYIRELAKTHLSIYKKYFEEIFSFNIKNVEDFVWALNFMCKWCWVRLDHVMRLNNNDFISHYYTFFSHKLFQSWALYKKKYQKSPKLNPYFNTKLYKKEFKEYIYAYDKNTEYLNNKGKESSLVEYTNTNNISNFSTYSNHGIQIYNVEINKNESKYKVRYKIHKHLAQFYK